MLYRVFVLSALACSIRAQAPSFPLESVKLNGTTLSQEVVLQMAGLQLGTPVNEAAIDAACRKLERSGLYSSIDYKYAPGPQRGYVVTLDLDEKSASQPAAIDIPGTDETEVWNWLKSKYPEFDRAVPDGDVAQQFLAREIEAHLGDRLEGQHVVVRLELNTKTGRMIASFQPENPPQIAAMEFPGRQEIPVAELASIMTRVLRDEGYIERRFRDYLELNVRRAYEQRGMYRVRFPSVTMKKTAPGSVTITTTVEEGPKFTLGEIRFIGEDLPVEAMVKEGKFRPGQIANWIDIEQGVYRLERPVKRQGYMDASARATRVLHDDKQTLDLDVTIRRGTLYRFGELRISGLAPNLETKARKIWKLQPGDPFDYAYPNDFYREFSKTVDFDKFSKFNSASSPGAGDHVMDITLVFVAK